MYLHDNYTSLNFIIKFQTLVVESFQNISSILMIYFIQNIGIV